MLNFGLVIADFQADLLIPLGDWVQHADFKFTICGLWIIPLLSNCSDNLFAFMNFLNADLHQVLLTHFNQIYSSDMVLLNYLRYFLSPCSIFLRVQNVNYEPCYLCTPPLHYISQLRLWWWSSCALLIFLVLSGTIDSLVPISGRSCHHWWYSLILICIFLQGYFRGQAVDPLENVRLSHC
jgi:hypothetical protein